ncbi:hypothetical protein Hanom_Chr10g00897241 [Helianthus anomalus]
MAEELFESSSLFEPLLGLVDQSERIVQYNIPSTPRSLGTWEQELAGWRA